MIRAIAALSVICSLLTNGPDAVAMWTLGILMYGFSIGLGSHGKGGDR